MSSQPSGSTAITCDSGKARAIPAGEAAAAAGDDHHRRRGAELLPDLDSDAALPLDHVDVVERGHEGRAALGGQPSADRLAALGGAVVEDDLGAGLAGGVDLHPRRVGGHDDGRCDAEPPGGERDPLGMVSGREGDHAARALGFVQLHQPVGRAAQFEAAALLQALGLDPDPAPLPIERQEGRFRDGAGDAPRRSSDTVRRRPFLFHPTLCK